MRLHKPKPARSRKVTMPPGSCVRRPAVMF